LHDGLRTGLLGLKEFGFTRDGNGFSGLSNCQHRRHADAAADREFNVGKSPGLEPCGFDRD
jgi:hypothetical protein